MQHGASSHLIKRPATAKLRPAHCLQYLFVPPQLVQPPHLLAFLYPLPLSSACKTSMPTLYSCWEALLHVSAAIGGAGCAMEHQKGEAQSVRSAPSNAGAEEDCAPCRALSDLLRGMPGMRDHTARAQPGSLGAAAGQQEAPAGHSPAGATRDCMTCRVLGTTVCGACSAYLAGHLYLVRPAARSHRVGLAAGSALFAGLGVLRAVN